MFVLACSDPYYADSIIASDGNSDGPVTFSEKYTQSKANWFSNMIVFLLALIFSPFPLQKTCLLIDLDHEILVMRVPDVAVVDLGFMIVFSWFHILVLACKRVTTCKLSLLA